MSLDAGTSTTRERRFSKTLLDDDGRTLDADEIENVTALGIVVDGVPHKISLEGLDELVLKRLIIDGLYDRLTRSVHAAKPAAANREAAIEVINETFNKLKAGDFKRHRKSGLNAPRAFDPSRFKTAIYAAAKALGKEISEEKFERLLNQLSCMSGKDRQTFIQKNFMRDPHFKTAWEKPVLDKKKALIKKGELESSLEDLAA
jgi:hypothetical protein